MLEQLTGYEFVEYVHWIPTRTSTRTSSTHVDEMLEREPRRAADAVT